MTLLYDALEKLFYTPEELQIRSSVPAKRKEKYESKVRQKLEEKLGSEETKKLEDYIVANADDSNLKQMAGPIMDDLACAGLLREHNDMLAMTWKAGAGMMMVMQKYFKESNYDLAEASEQVCTTLYDKEIEDMLEDLTGDDILIF